MEEDLRVAIDRLAATQDRSRNYVINTLCRSFLSKGAMHPGKKTRPQSDQASS